MKKLLWITMMMTLVFAFGCATPPKDVFKVDAGVYPKDYENLILCYLRAKLDKPDSLKEFSVIKKPEKIKADTYYPSIPLKAGDEVWESFVVYDAKNREGRHTGKDLHVVWFRQGNIVAFDYKDVELDFRVRQRVGKSCP